MGLMIFMKTFEYVKTLLKQADLVIGDFEGTVNKDHYLGGYPLFNAPGEVMDAIRMLVIRSWRLSSQPYLRFSD